MSDREHAVAASLSAHELDVGYDQDIIVHGIDFAIPRNAFTALVGANGSGKSTLLKALAGLLPAKAGAVMLDGRSITTLATKSIARSIGMLQQSPVAPDGLSVLELVRQGRYPHRSLFGAWSEKDETACREAISRTGMNALSERQIDSLSGGQRQRAWIALALAQETPILLLDEPTTYLDLAHQIEVMELVRRLVEEAGKTVVAVLHDLNQAARYADHMIALSKGAIAASGPPRSVMTEAMLREVFEVEAKIFPDPFTAAPMCIPMPHTPSDLQGL
ncbi:ABC transporter ATP-binding protein [Fulvimarina sp. MAC8]|uniref:ABC transporter ATP-binding protein n=1 Tax=Fulvimarina sp. MAC8 TaxID=3162874 RepID=UPI0032EB86D5